MIPDAMLSLPLTNMSKKTPTNNRDLHYQTVINIPDPFDDHYFYFYSNVFMATGSVNGCHEPSSHLSFFATFS